MTRCKNLNKICGGVCWIEGADDGFKGQFREEEITEDELTVMLFTQEAMNRKCRYAPYFMDEYIARVQELGR